MHVENELVEIVKEYEVEVLMREEVPEPPTTNSADTAPAQSKRQCITLIFYNHCLYMLCAFMLQEFYGNHMHRYTCPKSLTSAASSRCYA